MKLLVIFATLLFAAPLQADGRCVHGVLPDAACTPGSAMTTDLNVICGQSTRIRRRVSRAVRLQVYAEYGVSYPQPAGMYEVDHLIPLELGGSNELSNLWLEAAEPRPGYHEKDLVENWLHRQVCSGAMKVEDAQSQVATNWLGVWERMGK